MVGIASGLEVACVTWEGGGFEEGQHLRALKHSWLQPERRPFCPRPQASASCAGYPERLAPAQVVAWIPSLGFSSLLPSS